jgi:hypothetical protein
MAITRGVGPLYVSLGAQSSNSGVLNGTTVGRSLVAVIFWNDPAGTIAPTISVSGESNMTPIAGSKFTNNANVNNTSGQIYYLANNTGGGNKTITVNLGTSGYADAAIMEYVGLDTSSQPDASMNAAGTDPPTTSLTTTTANALIVAGGINNYAEFTAGSGYTLFGGGGMPNSLQYEESQDQLDMSGAASKTVAFTGFATNWAITAASFKIAGGAGTTPKTFTATDSLAGGELL